MYAQRPQAHAIVHLHCTCAVAVSCLAHADPRNVLPPLTAYHVMRVGTLPLLPYFRPGDRALADAVGRAAAKHRAVLLANHGPVVSGKSLDDAVDSAEELEQTAKLALLLADRATVPLTAAQVADLEGGLPELTSPASRNKKARANPGLLRCEERAVSDRCDAAARTCRASAASIAIAAMPATPIVGMSAGR